MAPAGDPREVLQLLQQFQEIQQQRAKHYALLHSAFKEFMSSGQEGPYRRLLADLTPAFNNCSLAVRHMLPFWPHEHACSMEGT
jgi:hypothetical protein